MSIDGHSVIDMETRVRFHMKYGLEGLESRNGDTICIQRTLDCIVLINLFSVIITKYTLNPLC